MLALLFAMNAAPAAELTAGELADTAYTVPERGLVIHPLTEPWRYGVTRYLEVRFSAQSLAFPGPELRVELAPLQTPSTALSFELGGQYQWSAGLESALRVAEDRAQSVPGSPRTGFFEAMANDVSEQRYIEGLAVARWSQTVVGPVSTSLTAGYGLGSVAGSVIQRVPTVLFVDYRGAQRTILRVGGNLDMATLSAERETTWSVDLRWAHAWDRFRVEAGARFVTGSLRDASIASVENVTGWDLIELPIIPLPTFLCWWAF
jgi:hypothetical protein